MEQGSLLEQALRKNRQHDSSNDDKTSKNLLLLDVFLLHHQQQIPVMEQLLQLANLSRKCNTYMQTVQSFHWHYGGDGPIFGVHVGEEGIPHLRAYCHYGPSIADEWVAVQAMMTMSQELLKDNDDDNDDDDDIAISCWDVEDGQIIFIQTAEALPESFDQDPTDNHRYSCWIRNGAIQLLQQPHISLSDALNFMTNQDRLSDTSHSSVQKLLQQCLLQNREHAFAKQRTPLVLPRKVATLIRNRPELIHAAAQSFCNHIEEPCFDLHSYEDWVWTTASLSRTNYAMLRTMVSSEWTSEDFIPPTSVEVTRYKRQCKMESMPYLRHAVTLGVRLVAGLEFLSKSKRDTMSMEQRIAGWSRVEGESGGDGSSILSTYQQGPNHAQYDLTGILKCPVFPEEAGNPTLYSYPTTSIKQQILDAQKSTDPDEDFPMPTPDQIDDERWMALVEDGNDGSEGTNDLDRILSRFQTFMVQPADIEGVALASTRKKLRRHIRPRVVMNILQTVLKGDPLIFPEAEDPFFYQEDYDLMESGSGDYDNDDDGVGPHPDRFGDLQGVMNAMDMELQQKSASRQFDGISGGDDTESDNMPMGGAQRQIEEDTHVLSNLLQSLEASAGESGPVPNILKGMGSDVPKDKD